MNDKVIYILTGAHDTGKGAALDYLAKNFGYAIKEEAFRLLRNDLGEERFFHAPEKPFQPNDSPNHICPVCRPKELTTLLLRKQLEIERNLPDGITIIERGFCDYFASLRFLGINDWKDSELPKESFAKYKLVFLMEVMNELQEPKFGKSLGQRIGEAIEINDFLFREYLESGFRVILVPRGTINDRANLIDFLIKRKGSIPFFGAVDYSARHINILAQIHAALNRNGLQSCVPLFRVTSSYHLTQVLRYGTDRAGFKKEMDWKKTGYFGGERKFEDVVYGSAEEDILRGIKDKKFSTAFKKILITKNPHILVYDKEKLELVHRSHQYAFLDPENKLDALICVLKIKGI